MGRKNAVVQKNLNAVLYAYVELENFAHAKEFGKKYFGSQSTYVNYLISKDRGTEPKSGSWKPKGSHGK